MEFSWDEAKSEATLARRGFDFAYASRVFLAPVLVLEEQWRGEARSKAVGEVGGNILVVVFTARGEVRRIISARRASRKERRQWQAYAEH